MLTRLLALLAVLLLTPSMPAHANARALSLESASLGFFTPNRDFLKEIPDLTHCYIKEKSTERAESSNRREEYLRARYMDPAQGRFLGMDPFEGAAQDPVTLHKYLYANTSPISHTDPSGRTTLAQVGVVLNGVGIGVNVATYAVNIISGNYVGLAQSIVEDVASTLVPGGALVNSVKRLATFVMRGKKFIVGVRASASALRHNMKQIGIVPCSGCAAHHIIPGTDSRFPSAVEARNIIDSHGVDINSFVNGVFLPTRRSAPPDLFPSTPHIGGHSEEYYKDVLETLRAYGANTPGNKDALYAALKDIQDRLLSGELRLNSAVQ